MGQIHLEILGVQVARKMKLGEVLDVEVCALCAADFASGDFWASFSAQAFALNDYLLDNFVEEVLEQDHRPILRLNRYRLTYPPNRQNHHQNQLLSLF